MYKLFTLAAAIAVLPVSTRLNTENVAGSETTTSLPPGFLSSITPPENLLLLRKTAPQAIPGNWQAIAKENIRKAEYHFTWEEKSTAYCTPNRKHNLRFFYDEKGFVVEPKTTQVPVGEFDPMKRLDEIKYKTIPNWKIKFELDKKQAGNGSWKITGNRAEYVCDKMTVQYINNEEGMRQNFVVHRPLSGDAALDIRFNIKTKLRTTLVDNRALHFSRKHKTVLQYEQLKVWDATGKALEAAIKKNKNNSYSIHVNTNGAVYPVTIDPLSTTPASSMEANQANTRMGYSVSSAGDVNGDGYSDVIVGAYSYDNGQTDEGAAFLYHGSAAGITPVAAATLETNYGGGFFGWSVSTAGDVNGDVIIGAPSYDNGQTDEGRVFIYHGSASGINTVAAAFMESNQVTASLGYAVAGAGDVNGDGYSDVIGAAYGYDSGQTDEGAVFIYHGSAAGINTTPVTTLQSNQVSGFLGYSVASAGDVNGDGYSDVIAGAHFYDNGETSEGAAFVYHGSAAGIVSTAAAMVESNQVNAVMGFAVSSAGDVNGDGYSDVVVGAYQYSNGQTTEGRAFIYHGSSTGINTTAAATVESNESGALMGCAVACAGDVNGDGYSDVIVGSYLYDNGQADEGAAFVYPGSPTGINIPAVIILEANQATARFGISVASAGDVNGDGYSDVIAGASLYDNGDVNEGAAFVFHGSADGLSATPNSTPDDADQADANFGYAVAGAGDVNGDGYSDVIIGAPQYDEGANANVGRAFVYHGSATGLPATPNAIPDETDQQLAYFGGSVASAGDVNADGYSDVIIGASQYDDGANLNEGRAYVYHGSAAGLSATANSTYGDANQAGANFGISVASAGDVNGDGYSDVIIGAYQFDDGFSNEGAAFVYHGSATGLSPTPNSVRADAAQLNACFGFSVAAAGDVNGDGFGDVIIGAYNYNDGPNANEGRAFVYQGSATGISATPVNTPDDADQANANFGLRVAAAGDVNGDGYSDVIIGAINYDDGASNEGRVFVYHGSAAGLSATPNSLLDGSNQLNAYFGYSIACAGDVNGDGYSDVIIGAYQYDDNFTNEGLAFIYYGSATGLPVVPNSTPDDAEQANAFFGGSVAAAGDVNADGYSDVIIGAYGYTDGGNAGEGRAFVYNGNVATNNKRNNLRLYNSNLATPLNSSNFTAANFGVGLFARSFIGRDKGKLVWETRLNYNPYSGTPITNSTFFTAQQSSYSDLGLNGTELKTLVNKLLGSRQFTKVRVRIKYNPATAITGQVYSPWRNVSSIIDRNGMGVLPLELTSFKASWEQKGSTAKISFTTGKEAAICCFDIEKSSDGFNFNPIGTLPARNTGGIENYTYTDLNARNKIQYYRLKMTDGQGHIDYSDIQQLSWTGAAEILIFPNPTTDVLQVQLNSSFNKINVQVINSSGQSVKKLHLNPTGQTIKIPVQNLAAGKYWLLLETGGEKQVLQFVKQ